MKQSQKMIPLKELNLTNRFLFDEVMEDPQTHQDVLSIIFERNIPLLSRSETEKELRVSPQIRSVRMDVFSLDEDQNVYNTEMQDKRKSDLAKRSRYYQSMVDTSLLEPGIPNYNLLNASYIIMIMTFDLFGHKKYRYTFEAECREVPGLKLDDKAVRIFLNTRGENADEVSPELVSFLHYLENTTDHVADQSESERIRRIHKRVREVRMNEGAGVRYMQAWEERYYDKQEAREEGLAEGRVEGRIEGRVEGRTNLLKEIVGKKLKKNKTPEEIADALEEDINTIQKIINDLKEERSTSD